MMEPTLPVMLGAMLLGAVAGGLNALAGGGPIVVVAALAAFGLPADIASLTSTVALLPGQFATGARGREGLAGCGDARARRALVALAIVGGAAGALLLLVTPTRVFSHLLPWLILFATGLYAWNSRARLLGPDGDGGPRRLNLALFAPLAVYGGFYGGGNSFMVLALLMHARIAPRIAAHAKNILILLINAAATAIFVTSGAVAWVVAAPLGVGALIGGAAGVRLIDRLDDAVLRRIVIACGLSLGLAILLRP